MNEDRLCRSCKSVFHKSQMANSKLCGDCFETNRELHLRKRFGMTLQEYTTLLTEQGGGCAICGVEEDPCGRELCVDHDHTTGDVRGILCTNCNTGIGMLQDSPELLGKAIEYLR